MAGGPRPPLRFHCLVRILSRPDKHRLVADDRGVGPGGSTQEIY
jgi:hypothetical protein